MNYSIASTISYENSLIQQEKKEKGIYYTPKPIVKFIVDKCFQSCSTKDPLIIDPACGTGEFLIYAAEKLLKTNKIQGETGQSIYGIDIDARAVDLCKKELTSVSGFLKPKIFTGNSIDPDFISRFFGKFDMVISNPPYVRIQNLPLNIRRQVNHWGLSSMGDTDIYLSFFDIGVKLLKENGVLGFITPNSYFYSIAGRNLRKYLLSHKVLKVLANIDDTQVFGNKAITYTAITILKKENGARPCFTFYDKSLAKPKKIEFDTMSPERFIFNRPKLSGRRVKMSDITDIKVGIATLRDKIYLIDTITSYGKFIKEHGGEKFEIEPEITIDIVKVSKLKDEKSIKSFTKKIIFPYKKVNSKFIPFPENELKNNFPKTYKYLCAVKKELLSRDKGKRDYETWFAYGRPQGLNLKPGPKIFIPPITKQPRFVLCKNSQLRFYSGYAIFMKNGDSIYPLWKFLNSSQANAQLNCLCRKFNGGWLGFSKILLQDLEIPKTALPFAP